MNLLGAPCCFHSVRAGATDTGANDSHGDCQPSVTGLKCLQFRPMADHCPEGRTLYQYPGPGFEGISENSAESSYCSWVDQHDTFGLGRDVPTFARRG